MNIKCPNCDQAYNIGPEHYGQQAQCTQCGQIIKFPTPGTQPARRPSPYQPKRKSNAGPAIATLLIMTLLGGCAFWFIKNSSSNTVATDTTTTIDDTITTTDKASVTSVVENEPGKTDPDTPTNNEQSLSSLDLESDGPLVVVKPNNTTTLVSTPTKLYSEAELKAALDDKIAPYFEKHCIVCHGPDKERGDLRVDQVVADMNGDYAAFHLQNIVDEMTSENMPPEDEPQPEPLEAAAVIESLTAYIEAEKQRNIAGGGRPIRRLTRSEFINTSLDFYGVEIDDDGLPDDLLVGSFEGDVEHLVTTDLHIESYMRKARGIVKTFIADRENPDNPQSYNFFKNYVDGNGESSTKAHSIIQKFAILAKRGRPTGDQYGRQLLTVFQQGQKDGLPFWEALEEPLAMSICSIDSLLHFETRAGKDSVSGLELANRLSYTLWRSAPDFELVRLGRSGDLLDPEIKKQQVQRMMSDDKFDRFIRDFIEQWFELPRQDAIAVNEKIHLNFDNDVKYSMKEETIQFYKHLVEENLPITNLIDSEFMLLDERLANFYGIEGVRGEQFRPVARNNSFESKIRGGIVTHAGILMQGGTGDRTSIVERGAFITRKLLDAPPGDPPPDVDELPTTADASRLSGVELVKMHAESAQCAVCHDKIDPLGVALENFDAVGKFRTKEVRLKPNIASLNSKQRKNRNNLVHSVPIETKGVYHNGEIFDGIQGLKLGLMKRKDDLGRGYIKALIAFTNSREADLRDESIVDKLAAETATNHYPTREIIETLMLSEMITSF